eukprot:3904156-Rhodomonas_salina.1
MLLRVASPYTVLRQPMLLRVCYAVCGSEIADTPTRICGTETAYAATPGPAATREQVRRPQPP